MMANLLTVVYAVAHIALAFDRTYLTGRHPDRPRRRIVVFVFWEGQEIATSRGVFPLTEFVPFSRGAAIRRQPGV
jgi:hypothetical protein